MSEIRMSPNLTLPENAVTQTFAFLARRGAGKSYGAMKLAEGMLEAKAQTIALDPVGVWWSLRLAADGKRPAFDIPVFGGLHGDFPLEPGAGPFIADLLVDRASSAVLDVSMFRKGDRKRFATEFAEQLFHLKKSHRSPLHLFIEEAQVFVPQRAMGDEARMLGAFEDIIKLGRNFGIGATLISQRPQSVNKDALNQTEALFVLQTNGAQERKALSEWIVEHGIATRDLVDELPSLPIGTAYLWSPSWLRKLEKVTIGKRKTYDASATPVAGTVKVEPRPLSSSEAEQIKSAMAATIERAKADDPKALRAKIVALEKQLRDQPAEAKIKTVIEYVEVPAVSEQMADELSAMLDQAKDAIEGFREAAATVAAALVVARDKRVGIAPVAPTQGARPDASQRTVPDRVSLGVAGARSAAASPPALPRSQGVPASAIGAAPRAVLMAVASYPSGRATRAQIAALTGYSVRKSTLRNALSALRMPGLIESEGDEVTLTPAGRVLAGPPPAPKSTAETIALWRAKIKDAAAIALFDVLVNAYPKPLTRDELGARAGVRSEVSTMRNALSRLRTQGLLVERDGTVRATAELFPTGPL